MQSHNLATAESAYPGGPSGADVLSELERMLSSPGLPASERRRTFLRFIVEETLAGRAERLKGYTIALAVFGRDETFDSQSDPVVRLEARRLRRDLDCYYVDAGSDDPVRISIPKGSYVPHFEWHGGSHPPAAVPAEADDRPGHPAPADAAGMPGPGAEAGRAWPRYLLAGALAAVLLGAAGVAGWLLKSGQTEKVPAASADTVHGPSVVVLPFKALGSTNDSTYLADGIGQELVGNLMRFPSFRLYTLPIGFRPEENPEPAKLGRDLDVAYVVSGSVRADGNEIRVATQMHDAATGQVLWVGTYDRPLQPEALIRVQTDLAGEIATAIGSPYGVVNTDLEERLATAAVSSMQSYVCVLRAYVYRRSFSRAEYAPVLACLQDAVRREPGYSDAWAMLGWLHLDAGRFSDDDEATRRAEYDEAFSAATRAVSLAPDNVLALKALASINHYMGRFEDGERLSRRAVELNPYDPDTLAQLGWRLAVRGNFDEGIPILKRAIERTANPPGWYFHLIAVDLCLNGDYAGMLEAAEQSAGEGSGISQLLLAIANGALENRDAVREALRRMSGYAPLANDPAEYLRRHGATDEIVEALMAGLEKARQLGAGS